MGCGCKKKRKQAKKFKEQVKTIRTSRVNKDKEGEAESAPKKKGISKRAAWLKNKKREERKAKKRKRRAARQSK